MAAFPRITRARIRELSSDDTGASDEERQWLDLVRSTAPELAAAKRRAAVCGIADVIEYDKEKIVVFYDDKTYTLTKPTNSLRISRALEVSNSEAFSEFNSQGCVKIGKVRMDKNFVGVDADVITLLTDVAVRFFLTPYY